MNEQTSLDNCVTAGETIRLDVRRVGFNLVNAARMMIPMEGQRYVWKRAEGESLRTKIGEVLAVTAYQAIAYTPLVISLAYQASQR